MNIYKHSDYRTYLEEMLPTKGVKRGIRSKLAKFLDCRVSHITQVLQGVSNLSPEMAFSISSFLDLSNEEAHFFMLLTSKEKAGNHKLQSYYTDQIQKIQDSRLNINERLNVNDSLNDIEIMTYYSSWHFAAIHMLCSLEKVMNISDIENLIKLDTRTIKDAVSFLIKANILKESNKGLLSTGRRIHLPKTHPMINSHHKNWRIKTMEALLCPNKDSVHYSGLYSISKKDLKKIKDILLDSLCESEKIVADSKATSIAAICLDVYEL